MLHRVVLVFGLNVLNILIKVVSVHSFLMFPYNTARPLIADSAICLLNYTKSNAESLENVLKEGDIK